MKRTHNSQWAVKAMTDEDLEQALHRELSAKKTNWDAAQLYLHELHLRARGRQKSTAEDLVAYQGFLHAQQQLAVPPKKHPWRFLRAAALVAAVICLLVLMPTAVLGTGGVFGVWTDRTFRLNGQEESHSTPKEYLFQSENPSLQQLHTLVVQEYGEQCIVPTWIPEDFKAEELCVTPDYYHIISGYFTVEDHIIQICYQPYREIRDGGYSKDNMIPTVYTVGGVNHYIFSNAGHWTAVWIVNGIECFVATSISRECLIQIIDSIYKGC